MNLRIGHGYDVHRLVPGRALILGGVQIDYSLERSIEAFSRIGYGQIETLIAPYRQSGVLLQLEKRDAGSAALYDEISRSVGRPVDPKAIDAAVCGFLLDTPTSVGLPELDGTETANVKTGKKGA